MYGILFVIIFVSVVSIFLASECPADQYAVSQKNPDASDENPGTQDKPFKTIAKALSVLKDGDSIIIHEGIYRERIQMPKGKVNLPVSIEAAAKEDGGYKEVIISGADIISNWERYYGEDAPQDAIIWVHKPWTHVWIGWNEDMSHGAPPPIGRSEQVVVDGKLLKPVLSIKEMGPGTFFADPKGTEALYVRFEDGKPPNEHLIEASVRDVLISAPDYTNIRGLILRHAANRAQQGAMDISGKGILVEDCAIEWTNGSGIRISGENFILRRTITRNNGQMGLGGSGRNFLIEKCVFQDNNVKGFPSDWEAGGFKIVRSWGAKIEQCKSVGNHGPGMWFDIDNYAGEVRQCYCADNDNSGIFVEISGDFLITDNLCVNNGGVGSGDWAGAGISIGESRDCYVAFNTCVDNQYGISIRGQIPRKLGDKIFKNRNITIRNNILAYNRVAQFGLMWDQSFMGRHPGQRNLSQAEWEKQLQDAVDPDDVGLILDHNLYAPTEKAELVRWGVSWRPNWKAYNDLSLLTKDHGLEAHGRTTDPKIMSWQERDFNLMPDSPAVSDDGYVFYGARYPIEAVQKLKEKY